MEQGPHLLADAGIRVRRVPAVIAPTYPCRASSEAAEASEHREMLALAAATSLRRRRLGSELEADVVELLDTGLDPVQLVRGSARITRGRPVPSRRLIVASEYERLTGS